MSLHVSNMAVLCEFLKVLAILSTQLQKLARDPENYHFIRLSVITRQANTKLLR